MLMSCTKTIGLSWRRTWEAVDGGMMVGWSKNCYFEIKTKQRKVSLTSCRIKMGQKTLASLDTTRADWSSENWKHSDHLVIRHRSRWLLVGTRSTWPPQHVPLFEVPDSHQPSWTHTNTAHMPMLFRTYDILSTCCRLLQPLRGQKPWCTWCTSHLQLVDASLCFWGYLRIMIYDSLLYAVTSGHGKCR